jgi:hypothetical protein
MCQDLRIGQEHFQTPAQLRKVMPILVRAKDEDGMIPDEPVIEEGCLCPFDIEATCTANGYRFVPSPSRMDDEAIKL